MPQPHVIRLRGPWLCWSDLHDPPTPASTITIDFRDHDGLSQLERTKPRERVFFERRFHRPTGLTDASSVHLVFEIPSGEMMLTFNGKPLGSISSGRQTFEIIDKLQSANRLRIELPAAAIRGGRGLSDLFSCHLEID